MSGTGPPRPHPVRPGSGTPDPDEEVGRVLALLGGSSRKGYWEPPAHLQVFAVMGGVELDFREASLFEGETIVDVYTLMGGANIVAPPDVHVRCSGTGVMGGFSNVENRAEDPDAPTLVIRGFACMGGVEVRVKKLPLLKRIRSD